jgi:hypothetical protein
MHTKSNCSCLICKKQISTSNFNSHYNSAHLGIRKANFGKYQGTNKFQVACCCVYCKIEISYQNLKNHQSKCVRIKNNCKLCGVETNNIKFCNRSCSAKFNNKVKVDNGWKPSEYQIQQSILKNSKNRLRELTCTICKKPFLHKKGRKTCSTECLYICRIEISRKAGHIGGKISAAKNKKRSKQEIELFLLCSAVFSNISHNEPTANGWDADILLNDHKIAILWNGPWHYKEMNIGSHSLKQVQNRDKIKIQEFNKIGWKVLVYEDRYFTPHQAFLDILAEVSTALT